MLSDVSGNVLDAKEDYICHQCNCITSNSMGLAKDLFERYPHANTYRNRRRYQPDTHDKPGTILVADRIINMFAQLSPGKPTKQETRSMRLHWFEQCLTHISQLPNIKSIAMPSHIGCGLAGGDWKVYRGLLQQFVQDHNITVVLYTMPSL